MKPLAQPEFGPQGHRPNAPLPVDVARTLLQALAQPVADTQTIALMDAPGRVLAQDVISPVSVPPHDNSAMDGYAFDGAQLPDSAASAPLTLRVVGTARAGQPWPGRAQPGECVRIMTGAVMPTGLDTVVPQEQVQASAEAITIPAGTVRRGDHRRLRGEDLQAGQPALRQGQRLNAAACGLLASLGLAQVTAWRRIRVACLSTGDELLSSGDAPRDGAIYDSNRHTLRALLTQLGCEVIDLGAVRDEPGPLEAALRQAAAQADAIITSGGVSVGEADHTRAMMQRLGQVAFWRIAMRPGQPLAAGQISSSPEGPAACHYWSYSYQKNSVDGTLSLPQSTRPALLLGLPGNPVAAMVSFLVLVRPALLRLMGANPQPQPLLKARSLEAIGKKPGRTEYPRAVVQTADDGTLTVRTTGPQGSGVLRSMVEANGLIVLPHNQGRVAAGDWVEVMMLDGLLG